MATAAVAAVTAIANANTPKLRTAAIPGLEPDEEDYEISGVKRADSSSSNPEISSSFARSASFGSDGKNKSWISKSSFLLRGPLAKMAPHEVHLAEQMRMFKRTGQGNWIPRQVALTKLSVHLARDGQREDIIIDSIPLEEVTSISMMVSTDFEVPAGGIPNSTRSAVSRHSVPENVVDKPVSINIVDVNKARPPPGSSTLTPPAKGPMIPSFANSQGDFHHLLAEEHAEDLKAVFNIKTIDDGYNSGRMYIFKAHSEVDAQRWIEVAKRAVTAAKQAQKSESRFREMQAWARNLYNSDFMQGIVIFLIGVSFVANVLQAQLVPEEDSYEDKLFWGLDLALTILFLLELLLNMFGHWMWDFFTDGWSLFDLVVVVTSAVALLGPVVQGLSVMRVVRAFRALRIIGKLRELRRIVHALASSLFPVINALFIGAVVNCVFAIIAVQFFKEKSPEHFGNFLLALYTMFIMALYEAPFDDDLQIYNYETKTWDWGLVIFFGLFILIEVWTLLQVMVAVLLDHFISASSADRREEVEASLAKSKLPPHALDPILENLSTRFHTSSDLDKRIKKLFERLDVDSSATLSFDEMREGLKKIPGISDINLSRDEFESMIHDYESQFETKVHGDELSPEQFRIIMRRQLKVFIQRSVANTTLTTVNEDSKALFSAIKLSMLDEEENQSQRNFEPRLQHTRSYSNVDHAGTKNDSDKMDEVLSVLAAQTKAIKTLQSQMQHLDSRLSSDKGKGGINGVPAGLDIQFEGEYEIPTVTPNTKKIPRNGADATVSPWHKDHVKNVQPVTMPSRVNEHVQHIYGDLSFTR